MERSVQHPAGYAPPAIAARHTVAESLIGAVGLSDPGHPISAHFEK